jgi:hypothetical protein
MDSKKSQAYTEEMHLEAIKRSELPGEKSCVSVVNRSLTGNANLIAYHINS